MGMTKPEKQEVADALIDWLKATYEMSKEDNHMIATFAQRLLWKEMKGIAHKLPAAKKEEKE